MDSASSLDTIYRLFELPLARRFLIVLIYAVLAKVADVIIDRVLRRIAAKTRIGFDDKLIDFLHVPIVWSVIWFGVLHALSIQPYLMDPWQTVLPPLAKSFLLIIWLIGVIRMFNWIVDHYMSGTQREGKIGKDLFLLFQNLLRVVAIIAGLIWLLSIWKVNLTPLFASAGIVGIAVALAAKDTLSNFFGGISIFMDKTYKIGEYIILESGERGEVVVIGIRSTRLKTRDDVIITIPNSIMANSKIINESAPIPRFRIRVPIGVAYGSDLEKVEQVLLDVADANPNVEKTPEPRIRLRTFADSSVNFQMLCWVGDPRAKGLETHNLLKAAYKAFYEQGITIPYPQRDVHIISSQNDINETEIT
jgi:small-conductance mechanosensitive channel